MVQLCVSLPLHEPSHSPHKQVTESRELSAKYNELKSQAMFIRSSPDFYKTDWIGDSSTGLDVTSDRNVFATLLKNPDTSASFYIVRHRDSTSK